MEKKVPVNWPRCIWHSAMKFLCDGDHAVDIAARVVDRLKNPGKLGHCSMGTETEFPGHAHLKIWGSSPVNW